MIGSCEIFSEETGLLVYSDGFARTKRTDLDTRRHYIMVRRIGPGITPRFLRMRFSLNEFLSWHLHGDEASLRIFSRPEQRFIIEGAMPYED